MSVINKLSVFWNSPFLFCSMIAIMYSINVNSQQLPSFKMTLSNGKTFNSTELPKGKPVVLIYFDPDCDHCQRMMDTLTKKINDFRNAELVLVTYKPVTELATFEKKYNIHKYENIRAGTEGTLFYLRNYYKLIKMPFIALYDKKGNYSDSYRDQVPLDDLLNRLNKLK